MTARLRPGIDAGGIDVLGPMNLDQAHEDRRPVIGGPEAGDRRAYRQGKPELGLLLRHGPTP